MFGRLARFAELGKSLLTPLSAAGLDVGRVNAYLDALGTASARLQSMAAHQRAGTPHSDEDLAFINDAVRITSVAAGCTTVEIADGWYARLFFDPNDAKDTDPTIADVHTQPADDAGNIVGKVLHVGTGYPRLMVMTVDSCNGPRAYAGLVSSYFEKTTTNFERLTDETWSQTVSAASPADVSWLEDLVER